MALDPNNQYLVDTLEKLPLLDGRFSNLRLVNFNAATGEKRGVFSLVFKADDVVEGHAVALKFYDISVPAMTNAYRRDAFKRECDLLLTLKSRARCLQLVKPLGTYSLSVPTAIGTSVALACEYFVVEWIDADIDSYFLDVGKYDAVEKLKVFKNIVLAVEALHRSNIFHRDLKPDNFRISRGKNSDRIVAIDLGTAARMDSKYVHHPAYGFSVGALGYAAPEALCGLSGNRMVAPLTDFYSIGCLLFELFNSNMFFHSNFAANTGLQVRLAAMAAQITIRNDESKQLAQWDGALDLLGHAVNSVEIDGPGSKVPAGIAEMLNRLLGGLTNFDYRKRPYDLRLVREKVEQMIRVLENERLYQRQLARKKEMRRRRLERIAELDLRFNRRHIGGN